MLRAGGEAVLIDFGLSRHLQLPDLPAEEFDGPIGTGAYISPEQILARGSSTLRRYLGSVSAHVVAQAPCTVTVVRGG